MTRSRSSGSVDCSMIPRLAVVAALLSMVADASPQSSLSTLLPGFGRPLPGRRGMEVVAEWRTVDFVYPSRAERESALLTGDFVPKNVVVLDVDAYGEGKHQRIFVTTPRFKPGVPATLSELSVDESIVSPKLRPFPSWAWNDQGDCDNLISVFRTSVDQCGRLWVIDSGTVNVFTGADRVCPPKLVVFDLRGRDGAEEVARYTFPKEQRQPTTLTITVAVDVRSPDRCGDAFAYVADVTEPAVLVYDMRRNRSWRVLNNLFYPYPLHGNFKINGAEFDLMDGVFGMAVGPVMQDGDRRLFFHSLASVRESWVSTRVLRNQSNFGDEPIPSVSKMFHVSEPRRTSQAAAEGVDANGVLFFGLLSENALACWNTRLPYASPNLHVVAKDDKTMQFASGLKVIGRHVWMLSSRFQNVMVGRERPDEVNYRVLVAPIADLVAGTSCAVPGGPLDNLVEVDTGGPPFRPSASAAFGSLPPSAYGGGTSSMFFGSTQPTYGPSGLQDGQLGHPHGVAPSAFGFSQYTPHPRPGMYSHQPSSYHQQHHGSGSGPSASGPSGAGFSGTGSGGDSIVFRDPVDRF